ncbi:MAG: hypothetical protein AAF566_05345 [Pseudomonadota bacterium]
MRLLATSAFFAASLLATSAAAQFQEMVVTKSIEVDETVQASAGTMSGSQRLAIRTNTLFAAFQLIRSESAKDNTISIPAIRAAPIKVPQAAAEQLELFFCAEIKTVNGFYEALGTSTKLEKAIPAEQSVDASNAASGPLLSPFELFETKESHFIDDNYSEDLMLLRAFVAPDCAAGQSSYYVPLYFDDSADTLLAVFEIGNANVEATIRGISADGRADPERTPFVCEATKRVASGFDCTLSIFDDWRSDHSLFEVRVSIEQAFREKQFFLARITLPELRADESQ